ncbi:MAG: hypothetical protein R2690_11835 [Acidimicrobiales bacterium]
MTNSRSVDRRRQGPLRRRARQARAEEGMAQYHTLDEHDLDRDPWADPNFTRDPIVEGPTSWSSAAAGPGC